MLCMSKMSKMSKIHQIQPKGCNAMYVEDVQDGKRTYTHFWLITSLILNGFSIPEKVLESSDLGLSNHTIKYFVY